MTASQPVTECNALIDSLTRQRFERLEQALTQITRTAATVMDVDHVSVWLFSQDYRLLNRIYDYPETGRSNFALTLDVSLRPEYRRRLARESLFRLTDSVDLSPRGGDGFAAYLRDSQIGAVLDSAIVIDDKLAGVLCHEHRDPRGWTQAQRSNAKRLADIAAEAIVSERRRRSTAVGQRFRLLVENSVDAIAMASAGGMLEYLNPAARAILGLAPDEPVLCQRIIDFVDYPSRERVLELIFPAAKEQGSWKGRLKLLTRQGDPIDVTITANVYRGPDGEVEYIACVIRDLPQQIDIERRVEQVRAGYEATLAQSGDSLFVIDTSILQIRGADSRFQEMLGYTAAQRQALTLHDLSEESQDDLQARVDRTLKDGHLLCGERRLRHAKGGWVDVEMSMIRGEGADGQSISVRLRDIRELVQRRRDIEHMAYYDPLTGLANNNLLRERAETMLAASLANGPDVGFILLQIERWQRISDIQGYQIAESLIRQAGARVKKAFAGRDVTLARVLGGVEIAVLFDASGRQTESEFVRIAHDAFKEHFRVDGERSLQIGIRSGSARAPLHAVSFKNLTKRAGIALRTAHRRNLKHCSYDPTQSSRIQDERLLEEDLRHAIGTPQLTLRYQPMRTVADADCWWAVEALVRWHHPQLGFLTPGDFIPLAEESQLIVALDQDILQWATRAASAWQGPLEHAGLSVNISAITLMNANLAALVQEALAQSGLVAQRLYLEVTETTIMLDRKRAAERLREVHALGVNIALDDFGTGYSSLAYLKDLPVDILKIDRDFLRGIGTDKRDERTIQAIIQLGHDLDIKVLAEGVETEAQRRWLTSHEIDFMQGSHIAVPMTTEDLQQTPPAAGIRT